MPFPLDSVAPENRRALAVAGFRWNETGVWVNQRLRRAIGFETVRDHDSAWLRRWLRDGQD
jgi:hypothetical protein